MKTKIALHVIFTKFYPLKNSRSETRRSLVDCVGLYGNDPAESLFFNFRFVSRSNSELSTPICAFMGLRSHDNLPCLVNLALSI